MFLLAEGHGRREPRGLTAELLLRLGELAPQILIRA
jgi:hypothetical protein